MKAFLQTPDIVHKFPDTLRIGPGNIESLPDLQALLSLGEDLAAEVVVGKNEVELEVGLEPVVHGKQLVVVGKVQHEPSLFHILPDETGDDSGYMLH